MTKNNEPHHYKKTAAVGTDIIMGLRLYVAEYDFVTGLNSLYLGYIDYDSGSIAFAMTCGLLAVFSNICRACFKRGNYNGAMGYL
mgnify:CR=1 FL=1